MSENLTLPAMTPSRPDDFTMKISRLGIWHKPCWIIRKTIHKEPVAMKHGLCESDLALRAADELLAGGEDDPAREAI